MIFTFFFRTRYIYIIPGKCYQAEISSRCSFLRQVHGRPYGRGRRGNAVTKRGVQEGERRAAIEAAEPHRKGQSRYW